MPAQTVIILKSEMLNAKARFERLKLVDFKVRGIHAKTNNLHESETAFFEQVICQIYNYDYEEIKETREFVRQAIADKINKF